MLKKISVLFALLSLVAVGACGGESDGVDTTADDDSTEPLTNEEFIERGDAICSELDLAADGVEPPADESDYARFLKEVLPPAERALQDFEDISPPQDGEDIHEALVGSLRNSIEAVEGAITAAESGDTVTAEDLLSQADQAADVVDEQAKAYGFQECGADDVDEEGSEESTPDDEPLPEEPDPQPIDPEPEDQTGEPDQG